MLHKIDEIQGIGLHLDIVLRKIQEAYLQKFEKLGADLTIEQWVILHQIYKLRDRASQREIVQLNFRNRATISRVIGGLERKGFLRKTRFQGDKKQFKLELTHQGQKMVENLLPHAMELRNKAVNNLSLEEFETFMTVLHQIKTNYQNQD